jgi:hypothetical protein
MSITEEWIRAHPDLGKQVVPPMAAPIELPIEKLESIIRPLAREFAIQRYGHAVELRYGGRGLHVDDSAAFLRGVKAGHLELEEHGSFTVSSCRPKPGGTRYSLFTENRWNNDYYISLNTENLIHFGAATELVSSYDWDSESVEVEVGEFDARASRDGRVVLLMEAKARVDDTNGLAPLLKSFLRYAQFPRPPEPTDNHSRKYVELLRQAESGPVLLWLVAAGARWAFTASRRNDRIELEEASDPSLAFVQGISSSHKVPIMKRRELKPVCEHAVARAMLTEIDGRQRVYEHPWQTKDEIYAFIAELKVHIKAAKLTHTNPWVWTAETSTGKALTPCGKDTGLELRFSYSP